MEFKNCKLVVSLQAQSPMVHFQGDEIGATLRGSELKPKLDRFLEKKNKFDDVAYIDKEKHALNYKVAVEGENKGSVCELARSHDRRFAILYGDRDGKKVVLRDAKLTILCMNKELQEAIETDLVEFFAVTNFGYMQNKGFGSFMPIEYMNGRSPEEIRKDVAGWLRAQCNAKACYYMDFANTKAYDDRKYAESYDFYFSEIKDFYDLLKTGRNLGREKYSKAYIYQYMHEKKIDNEKAWMKATGLAPAIKEERARWMTYEKNKDSGSSDNAKYVRALLGVGSKVEFINSLGEKKPGEKVTVTIKHDAKDRKKQIERMDSPIYFKIIQNYVFICAERIPSQIYGETFRFSAKIPSRHKCDEIAITNEKSLKINVPDQKMLEQVHFSIDDLLEKYVKYYNGKTPGEGNAYLRAVIPTLKRNRYVNRV